MGRQSGDLGLSDLRPLAQGVVLTKEAFLMFGHAAWLLALAGPAPVIISFALLYELIVQLSSGHYKNLFYLQSLAFHLRGFVFVRAQRKP